MVYMHCVHVYKYEKVWESGVTTLLVSLYSLGYNGHICISVLCVHVGRQRFNKS